jgi:large subunit ribosomal protein L41e
LAAQRFRARETFTPASPQGFYCLPKMRRDGALLKRSSRAWKKRGKQRWKWRKKKMRRRKREARERR